MPKIIFIALAIYGLLHARDPFHPAPQNTFAGLAILGSCTQEGRLCAIIGDGMHEATIASLNECVGNFQIIELTQGQVQIRHRATGEITTITIE